MIFAGGLGLQPGAQVVAYPGGLQTVRLAHKRVQVAVARTALALSLSAGAAGRRGPSVALRRTRIAVQVRDDGEVVVTMR